MYDLRSSRAYGAGMRSRGGRDVMELGGGAWRRLRTMYNTHDGPDEGARVNGR